LNTVEASTQQLRSQVIEMRKISYLSELHLRYMCHLQGQDVPTSADSGYQALLVDFIYCMHRYTDVVSDCRKYLQILSPADLELLINKLEEFKEI
jgi:hypothetical protein